MRAAYVVDIQTPKGYMLNGMWFGARRPTTVYIWVHGLGSSMFSKMDIMQRLAKGKAAVLAFNNRGHDKVAKVYRKGKLLKGGSAHEVFTECVDDIDGAILFAKKSGAKNVFLVGHSTGCQKSIYWASKRKRGVKGLVLMAPLSDYESERNARGASALRRTEKVAQKLVQSGRPHDLLPQNMQPWPWIADAQRFLSLYTGKSSEEIFTYWNPERVPTTLQRVKLPIFVLLAGDEKYTAYAPEDLETWFLRHIYEGEAHVIPGVEHGFKGGETTVARMIQKWAGALS